ncbi:unnamed protein product [Tuber aestivum]|uniref:Uncharacterized protein n=1 Tax=Tuber aestivum TaxID=59557 RepID=A0A292Q1A8_9PEZI|nr:unnamed protein product [Tuber aestivum]
MQNHHNAFAGAYSALAGDSSYIVSLFLPRFSLSSTSSSSSVCNPANHHKAFCHHPPRPPPAQTSKVTRFNHQIFYYTNYARPAFVSSATMTGIPQSEAPIYYAWVVFGVITLVGIGFYYRGVTERYEHDRKDSGKEEKTRRE